ncbi:hypothetical protein B296_00043392 [Ensete ventricosum]|uniref:Uncharacterized protein n=1 Tax=Ensete ventricosum TaxID=4639 RepID=A0A426XU79_ENSVE|nr:hypothetical protein B296_00043392 [Ensete ventricosum]
MWTHISAKNESSRLRPKESKVFSTVGFLSHGSTPPFDLDQTILIRRVWEIVLLDIRACSYGEMASRAPISTELEQIDVEIQDIFLAPR